MKINILKADRGSTLPLLASHLPAGFPSPADDYIEEGIDLNTILVKRPASTFFIRVQGHSMEGARIYSGDVLVVDRSLEPKDSDIIVAALGGEFTVKRLRLKKGKGYLQADHPDYLDIPLSEASDFQVWGVVTYVITKAR
jgi:DNA polymerase V